MTPDALKKLLAPFADPATDFDVRDLGSQLAFHLIRRGKPLIGTVDKATDKVTVDGADTIGLRPFFASSRLANLVALAQTQSRVFDVSQLISRSVSMDGSHIDDGLDALADTKPVAESTRVIIVSAPAGMGKTKLAEALVKNRADGFLARKEQRIALLVSSRGRRLSLLSDVIAATLGDLRAPITQHEVPPLVSLGLIDLIIDGFDELVNADGYRDAWESVGHLFDQIGGGGVVILSARDAFFSEQDFVARAKKEAKAFSLSLHISFLELLPLDDGDIRKLIDSRAVLPSLREPLFEVCQLLPLGLRGRPFFIERLAARVAKEGAIQFVSPLTMAIDDFIEREAPLLFGQNVTPVDQRTLCEFFEEVALEMRRQEADSIDVDTVRFFLDLVLENAQVATERRAALVHRAEAVAFMEIGGGVRRRGFPHEVVRDHFVSRRILTALRDGRMSTLKETISIGTFSLDLADALCRLLDHEKTDVSVEWCDRVLSLASDAGPASILGQNAYGLAFALVRRLQQSQRVSFSDVAVGNVSLIEPRLEALTFRRCNWASLDLSGCDARAVTFESCDIGRLRISAETVLPRSIESGAVIRCLEEAQGGSAREIRDQQAISATLQSRFVDDEHHEPETPGERLLLRLAFRWRRTGYLDADDITETPAFADPLWPKLRDVLERHTRLEWKIMPTKGPSRPLGVMRDAAALIRRWHPDVDQRREIEEIWNEAAALR